MLFMSSSVVRPCLWLPCVGRMGSVVSSQTSRLATQLIRASWIGSLVIRKKHVTACTKIGVLYAFPTLQRRLVGKCAQISLRLFQARGRAQCPTILRRYNPKIRNHESRKPVSRAMYPSIRRPWKSRRKRHCAETVDAVMLVLGDGMFCAMCTAT